MIHKRDVFGHNTAFLKLNFKFFLAKLCDIIVPSVFIRLCRFLPRVCLIVIVANVTRAIIKKIEELQTTSLLL